MGAVNHRWYKTQVSIMADVKFTTCGHDSTCPAKNEPEQQLSTPPNSPALIQAWKQFWPPSPGSETYTRLQREHPEVLTCQHDTKQPFERPWRGWNDTTFVDGVGLALSHTSRESLRMKVIYVSTELIGIVSVQPRAAILPANVLRPQGLKYRRKDGLLMNRSVISSYLTSYPKPSTTWLPSSCTKGRSHTNASYPKAAFPASSCITSTPKVTK